MSMSTPRCYRVDPAGNVVCLYSDDGPDLGPATVVRASDVEPGPDGTWQVTLSDHAENGALRRRVIGTGFKRRRDALAFEVDFIHNEILRKD